MDDDASYTLFQRSFWKRLYVLAAPFWFRPLRKGDSSRTAVGLLLGLLALIFITTWLLVKVVHHSSTRSPQYVQLARMCPRDGAIMRAKACVCSELPSASHARQKPHAVWVATTQTAGHPNRNDPRHATLQISAMI